MDAATDLGLAERRHRRFTRQEYERIAQTGMFEHERVELLHGVIVAMSSIGPPHSSTVMRLTALLVPLLAGRALVRIQDAFAVLDESEPEPDVAVVPLGEYDEAHPTEAHLIVEVADSSLRHDRVVKGPIYAAAGVPDYWLVDLTDRVVEVHRRPGPEGYARVTRHRRGGRIRLQAFPDLGVRVSDFLR